MFFRCCASLVLALVVSTCASSAGTSLGEEGEATTGDYLRLIVRAELDRLPGQSAWDAVSSLRPGWPRGGAGVRVNGIPVGRGSELHQLWADDIESMRFLSGIDARVKYGRDFSNGVIEVTMIGGG
jgi:hypothetical protein